MSKFTEGWYVIYTRPNHEKKVVAQLSEKKLDVFLPLFKYPVSSTNSSGVAYKERPLFPSYVFIRLLQIADFYNGMEVEGFIRYIRFGKDFSRVEEEVISNLKLILAEGRQIKVVSSILSPGCDTTIKRGALAGLKCKIIRHCRANKIFVNIALLNNTVSAILPFSIVL